MPANVVAMMALALAGCGDATPDASQSAAVMVVSAASAVALGTRETLDSAVTSTPASTFLTEAVAAIASNFDRAALIVPGYLRANGTRMPTSAKPDVVGAFRFICTPGQMAYDDPIIYPGVKGGSPHLHQFYGNTAASGTSTYASLRGGGDSTCSNALNRSAYWIPALFTGSGQVIRPDYMSVYYKRLPDGDPMCTKRASQGCGDIPTGLRVVSGYDMKRMGQAQPENVTYGHRCISPNKPSVGRNTLAEAVADCGGAGQIMTSIVFGSCWDGRLDSADHRAHLVKPTYRGQSYSECPKAGQWKLIPELTQQIAYTIKAEDGQIYFASDRMPGMAAMPGGSTFHADYMEAWDPATRTVWHRNCIGKLLNCSDGELGDGTMMKRGNLSYSANPRVVAAPSRI